jgi:hypothetical protein
MFEEKNETFVELCLKGRALVKDIDDFVERWHQGRGDTSLRDFLGFSETEYSLWINDPDVLPYVIYSRREQKPFVQVVNDDYYDSGRLAGHSDQKEKIQLLREWLQRQGYPAH